MRSAEIKMDDELAGWLNQDENGHHFQYAPEYITKKNPKPISLTMPIQKKVFYV